MSSTLRQASFAGVALLAAGAPSAGYATVVGFDPSQFVFRESDGQYSITNKSMDWYITGFSVTNPLGGSVSAWTSQGSWSAESCGVGCGHYDFGATPGFDYYDASIGLPAILTTAIGPGKSSNRFFFGAQLASDVKFDVTNPDGATLSVTPTGSVPEPASWLMMLAGFAALGTAAYGADRKRRLATASN